MLGYPGYRSPETARTLLQTDKRTTAPYVRSPCWLNFCTHAGILIIDTIMKTTFVLALLCLCAFVSCHHPSGDQSAASTDSVSGRADENADRSTTFQSKAAPADFDLDKIPVSSKPLGAFPYFGLPRGYISGTNNKPKEYDHFPFWVGDHFQWVEGKLFYNSIESKEDKEFSRFEVVRNLENLITAAGGVKVFEGKIPGDSCQALADRPDDITVDYVDGIGDIYNDPSSTYVLRRTDKTIWIHLCVSSGSGGWVIAETKPFEQTARLIGSDELKKQIDDSGKAIIHINFATDRADILPESLPQIQEVVVLLQRDAALKLSVNGYTDNTGAPAHNQILSEQRANSVVNSMVEKGADAKRLHAKGFGQQDPITHNDTPEGRAENRRVELVKL